MQTAVKKWKLWLPMIVAALILTTSLSGCVAANKTQARVFDSQVEFGGGLYLQEAEPDWD